MLSALVRNRFAVSDETSHSLTKRSMASKQNTDLMTPGKRARLLDFVVEASCIVTKEDSEHSGPPQANVSCSGLDLSYSTFILTNIITLFSLRLKYCLFKIATCARLDTKQSFDVNQKSRIIAQVPPDHVQRVYETVHTLGMMFCMYCILYAISVH